MQNSNESGSQLGFIILGAMAGAALGILFAPDKGSKTRDKLANNASDLANEALQRLKDEVSTLRSKADRLESQAKDKISEVDHAAKQKMDGMKHQVEHNKLHI